MNRREHLAREIRQLLSVAGPMKARQIASSISHRNGLGEVDRSEVNSVLYAEMSGELVRDAEYRWAIRNGAVEQHDPVPSPLDRGALLRAIMRLRSGLPPDDLIRHETVGFERLGVPLIDLTSTGSPTRWAWVLGNYGEGKTHVLALARELALAEGMAVCHMTADSASAALNYPQRFLPLLLSSLEVPDQPRRGLHELLDSMLRDTTSLRTIIGVVDGQLRRSRALDLETRRYLARLSVLADAGETSHQDFELALQLVVSNLCGHSISYKTGPGARELVYTLLRIAKTIVESLGATGPLILLDEVESLYTKLPNPQARMSARRVLSALCEGEGLKGIKALMSITPDAFRALRGDIPDMATDQSPLDEEQVATWASKIDEVPVVECRPLKASDRNDLLLKVRALYEQTYPPSPPSTGWKSILNTATTLDAPLRIIVRRAVDALDHERFSSRS
jgi:hypothetical protein